MLEVILDPDEDELPLEELDNLLDDADEDLLNFEHINSF